MKNVRFLLASLAAFTMCNGPALIAEDNDANVVLTLQEELETQARRAAVIPTEFLGNGVLFGALRNLDDNDYSHLYRIYPSANYFPIAISGNGDNIQLHDGSLWYVHPSQRNIVKNWVQTDKLFVKPNASCFSSYSYVLQNRNVQDKNLCIVQVSLLEAPINTGAYTRWIVDINPYKRLVYLNDNTAWYINPKDSSFSKWQIGHRLVMGVNNKWRTAEFPHIIINTGIYRAPYCEAEIVN